MLWSEEELTDAQIDHVMDTLQSCVVSPEEMPGFLERNPQAIVLRNVLKPFLNKHLALNHAKNLGQRVIVWRAMDVCNKTKRTLSAHVLDALDKLPPGDTNGIPTYMMFFAKIKYVFYDNENPDLLWVNNHTCTGERIILHKDEPDDDLTKDCWTLRYPPQFICVRPDDSTLGRVVKERVVPINCLPIDQKKTSFSVSIASTESRTTIMVVKGSGALIAMSIFPTILDLNLASSPKNQWPHDTHLPGQVPHARSGIRQPQAHRLRVHSQGGPARHRLYHARLRLYRLLRPRGHMGKGGFLPPPLGRRYLLPSSKLAGAGDTSRLH